MTLSILRAICAAFVLVLALAAATATAQAIYRSVDAQGNVTYSDQPQPAGAVNVEGVTVQPGPSDAEQREAQERVQREKTKANEMREAREQQQVAQPATPAAAAPGEPEDPVDQNHVYPESNPNPVRRDQVRDRVGGQPVQLPNRPIQLPARPEPR